MDADDIRLLAGMCEYHGTGLVAEHLGISEGLVQEAASGLVDFDDMGMAKLKSLGRKMFGDNDFDYLDSPSDVVAESVEDEEPPDKIGVYGDGDDEDGLLVSVIQARPGATWTDEQRQLRDGMRRSLAFAQMSRFRVDMTHQEYVSALGVVTRIELGLISWFGESVPDPHENWDASRRWREVERRIARLRWVSDEESKEFGGIKGILNRILGRRRLSGKEMYEKMVAEADWMVEAMRTGRQDSDVISDVSSYVGLGAGPPSLPGR